MINFNWTWVAQVEKSGNNNNSGCFNPQRHNAGKDYTFADKYTHTYTDLSVVGYESDPLVAPEISMVEPPPSGIAFPNGTYYVSYAYCYLNPSNDDINFKYTAYANIHHLSQLSPETTLYIDDSNNNKTLIINPSLSLSLPEGCEYYVVFIRNDTTYKFVGIGRKGQAYTYGSSISYSSLSTVTPPASNTISNIVSSNERPFTNDDIGNTINFISGDWSIYGRAEIVDVFSDGKAKLNYVMGDYGISGGNAVLGGSITDIETAYSIYNAEKVYINGGDTTNPDIWDLNNIDMTGNRYNSEHTAEYIGYQNGDRNNGYAELRLNDDYSYVISDVEGVMFKRIKFSVGENISSSYGICIDCGNNYNLHVTFVDCIFDGFSDTAIENYGSTVWLYGCRFRNISGTCMYVAPSYTYVISCYFNNCSGKCIDVDSGMKIDIQNCIFNNINGSAINIAYNAMSYISIDNNDFVSVSESAILLDENNVTESNYYIKGNLFPTINNNIFCDCAKVIDTITVKNMTRVSNNGIYNSEFDSTIFSPMLCVDNYELTENPFVDSQNEDFRLNNLDGGGAMLSGNAYPKTFMASPTITHADIGAIQSYESNPEEVETNGGIKVIGWY